MTQQMYAPQPIAYAGPDVPAYYSSEGRGRVVRAVLWILIALDLTGIGITLYQFNLPPDAFDNDDVEIPIAFLLALMIWALAYVGAMLTAIIIVCMWMYRAHANLTALGRAGQDYTSGWAAGAWFVPFLNLVRPFRIMKEIWKGSDSAHPHSTGWKLAPNPSIIGWWWAAWLISNFASNASTRMELRDGAELQHAILVIDLLTAPLSIAAAWCLIEISRRIDTMQADRFAALSSYLEPPQPPSPYAAPTVPLQYAPRPH